MKSKHELPPRTPEKPIGSLAYFDELFTFTFGGSIARIHNEMDYLNNALGDTLTEMKDDVPKKIAKYFASHEVFAYETLGISETVKSVRGKAKHYAALATLMNFFSRDANGFKAYMATVPEGSFPTGRVFNTDRPRDKALEEFLCDPAVARERYCENAAELLKTLLNTIKKTSEYAESETAQSMARYNSLAYTHSVIVAGINTLELNMSGIRRCIRDPLSGRKILKFFPRQGHESDNAYDARIHKEKFQIVWRSVGAMMPRTRIHQEIFGALRAPFELHVKETEDGTKYLVCLPYKYRMLEAPHLPAHLAHYESAMQDMIKSAGKGVVGCPASYSPWIMKAGAQLVRKALEE